jgi:hypothetical protein
MTTPARWSRMADRHGFGPRSARSERAASANCATSRYGDPGRIRTATGQALDLSPLPFGLQGHTCIPSGSAYGYRTLSASEAKRDESREADCSPRPITDRCHSPARLTYRSVVKEPALSSWKSARTARRYVSRSHDPTNTLHALPRSRLSRDSRPKTKKAFQGIALEGLMLDDCRASRARDPPCRSRVDR